MGLFEQAKALVSRGEIQEASTNIVEDTINAILGDPVSIGKIMVALAKSPFFVREQLFWAKIEAFLNGAYLNEGDSAKLRAKLTENGGNGDNPRRLVECIDRAETHRKIHYLINATRCLLTDFIDQSTYFRICHAVTHTLDEDLHFLKEHIGKSNLPYSMYTQGLLTSGLMYQSVIDADGEQKYSFTPIAGQVDRFAVSYDDIERYPNPVGMVSQDDVPRVSIPSPEWESIVASDNEVQKMMDEVFGN